MVLPQTVPELHKLVRQLQQPLEQRVEEVPNGPSKKNRGCAAKLQAAEEHRVRSDSARHAVEEKLQRLTQQVKQVEAQQQLAVKEAQAKEKEQAKRDCNQIFACATQNVLNNIPSDGNRAACKSRLTDAT